MGYIKKRIYIDKNIPIKAERKKMITIFGFDEFTRDLCTMMNEDKSVDNLVTIDRELARTNNIGHFIDLRNEINRPQHINIFVPLRFNLHVDIPSFKRLRIENGLFINWGNITNKERMPFNSYEIFIGSGKDSKNLKFSNSQYFEEMLKLDEFYVTLREHGEPKSSKMWRFEGRLIKSSKIVVDKDDTSTTLYKKALFVSKNMMYNHIGIKKNMSPYQKMTISNDWKAPLKMQNELYSIEVKEAINFKTNEFAPDRSINNIKFLDINNQGIILSHNKQICLISDFSIINEDERKLKKLRPKPFIRMNKKSVKKEKKGGKLKPEKSISKRTERTKDVTFIDPLRVKMPDESFYGVLYDDDRNVEMTVALPAYRSQHIAWLALESLCNQVNANFPWELIMVEESLEPFGYDAFEEYKERLIDAGCSKITYKMINKWIPLLRKWKMIGDMAEDTSKSFVLQAADCYAQPHRLDTTYNKINKENYDYISTQRTYIYDIPTGHIVKYDTTSIKPDKIGGSNMATKSKFIKILPNSNIRKNIDGFIIRNIQKYCSNNGVKFNNTHDITNDWRFGIGTNGFNNISSRRHLIMNKKHPNFRNAENVTIYDILPKYVAEKLIGHREYCRREYVAS